MILPLPTPKNGIREFFRYIFGNVGWLAVSRGRSVLIDVSFLRQGGFESHHYHLIVVVVRVAIVIFGVGA